jgi:hypothetical protein
MATAFFDEDGDIDANHFYQRIKQIILEREPVCEEGAAEYNFGI